MPRKEHSHHYIYKTTCNVTNRFYIGMHSTSNLNDGYVGSGQRLWKSINKHGKESHSVEILEWFTNRIDLVNREKELINEDLLRDSQCMNLVLGGEGGYTYQKFRPEHAKKFHLAGAKATNEIIKEKRKTDPEWKKKNGENISNSLKLSYKNGTRKPTNTKSFLGKSHSKETKMKMSKSKKITSLGERNSQFGTIWIYNEELKLNKKIKPEELINYTGWIKGRKNKF